MTNEEAKAAFFSGKEVTYHGDGYEITGPIRNIIYGKDSHNQLVVSVEIEPENSSLTRVRIKDVEEAV